MTVEYIVEKYNYPPGWRVLRWHKEEDHHSWGHHIAEYKTEERAKRVATFLQAVYDQGEEVLS